MIGRLKSQMAEPCIMCHWSMIGCDTRSLVTIHITSPEIGHVARSVLLVEGRVYLFLSICVQGLQSDAMQISYEMDHVIGTIPKPQKLKDTQQLSLLIVWLLEHQLYGVMVKVVVSVVFYSFVLGLGIEPITLYVMRAAS